MNTKIGKLIIITGFSGSGKDTLMNMLLKKKPYVKRVVTHTSRPIRKGEKGGLDYHFVSKESFEHMVTRSQLIEHVLYGSHYKGTSTMEFQRIFKGESLVWRIDMSRAAIIEDTFRKRYSRVQGNTLIKRTTKLLVKTSNPHIALSRYQSRDGDLADVEEFKTRLNQDVQIWLKHKNSFPHVIENITGRQNDALNEMIKIIDTN